MTRYGLNFLKKVLRLRRNYFCTLGAEFPPKDIAKNTRNLFWKDTLNTLNQFREINRNLKREEVLVHQELWYNNEIKIDRKCVFYGLWYDKGIRYIHDLFHEDGTFMSYESSFQKFEFDPTLLSFYG